MTHLSPTLVADSSRWPTEPWQRMQDGSLRTVETATAPPLGKAVTLKGKLLQPADGRK